MKKYFLTFCGLFFVFLAYLGILIPGLPTTVFLLLAAACFAKSSPKLHKRLLSNKIFGPIITNWQETRTIPRQAKRIAIITLFIVASTSFITLPNMSLKIMVLSITTIPIIILLQLKETEESI